MGGDEFLVAITAKPEVVSEKIAFFNQLVSQWHGKYVNAVTVSYGVVSASEYPDLNFEALLKTADERMYQQKRQQRENVLPGK